MLAGLAITACNSPSNQSASSPVPAADISLEKELLIDGSALPAEGAPMLGDVDRIAAGKDGRLHLYDSQSQNIFAYTPEGDFLHGMGREGSGPGEFGRVAALLSLNNGGVAAADRRNAQISIFGPDGELVRSSSTLGLQPVRGMARLPGGEFLLAGWHPERQKMVHVADSLLSQITASLLSPEDMPPAEKPILNNLMRSFGGHLEVLGPDRFAFVPAFYGGKLFLFHRTARGQWQKEGEISGFDNIENPLRSSPLPSQPVTEVYPVPSLLSFGSSNVTHSMSRSYGLYVGSDGHLVHPFFLFQEGSIQLVVEHYDVEEGQLASYGSVNLGKDTPIRPLAMDPLGRLLAAHADSARVLRITLRGLQP